MTRQEVFEKVVKHLLTQRKRAIDTSGCRYRINGLMCAAGSLIKDEYYYVGLEQKTVDKPSVREALLQSGIDGKDIELIGELQYIHDHVELFKWKSELKKLATDGDFNGIEWTEELENLPGIDDEDA